MLITLKAPDSKSSWLCTGLGRKKVRKRYKTGM